MSDRVTESVRKQCRSAWAMVENAMLVCGDEQWKKARENSFCVPAAAIVHIIETFDYYVDEAPSSFYWSRLADVEQSPPSALPDKTAVAAYLGQTRDKVNQWFDRAETDGLNLPDDVFRTDFTAPIERVIYALRHLQHHLGQLSLELQLRGMEAVTWE